jgi:hypothetical protein
MSYILNRGTEHDPAALRLYTTGNRNYIENERPDEDRPIESLQVALRQARSVSPSATCRSLTALYNCVGLVFAARRTSIDCKHLELILRDDNYRAVSRQAVSEGDVVVYRRNGIAQHVGIIYKIEDVSLAHDGSRMEIWVLSQWGEDGEYLHKIAEVPTIYGTELDFRTERRTPHEL